MKPAPNRVTLGIAFALILAFAAVVVAYPDNFFVDDTYFYLQVAWNIAHGAGSTFNGIIPTNGYHPLWMAVLVGVFKVIPEKHAAVRGVAVLLSLLNLGTLVALVRVIQRTAQGWWAPAFLLCLPFAFCTQLGTEGALSGALLSLLMLTTYKLCERPTLARSFQFSLLATLAVLARLDNIFIVGLVWAGVLFYAVRTDLPQLRRSVLQAVPVLLGGWGGYLYSNERWFGMFQPISGLLKAHPYGEAWQISRITPIAAVSMGIILISFPVVAARRRDLLFRVVEVPFTCGILLHAAYIHLVMSHETHWSWYYTSWVLLASLLLSRACAILVPASLPRLQPWVTVTSLVVLAVVWFKVSYRRHAYRDPVSQGVGFQRNFSDRLHLHRVLAFDLAGRMAFYSDVQIVALDGLMGDLQFQKDLAAKGIQGVVAEHRLEAFVGPAMPLDESNKSRFCDHIFLSSMRFHCVAAAGGGWNVDRVTAYARLEGREAGTLELPATDVLWNDPEESTIAVWRLPMAESTQHREK